MDSKHKKHVLKEARRAMEASKENGTLQNTYTAAFFQETENVTRTLLDLFGEYREKENDFLQTKRKLESARSVFIEKHASNPIRRVFIEALLDDVRWSLNVMEEAEEVEKILKNIDGLEPFLSDGSDTNSLEHKFDPLDD